MRALRLSYLAGLRNGWRGVLLVGLLCGIAAGSGLAAAADARRTWTAAPRLLEAQNTADAAVGVDATAMDPEAAVAFADAIDRLPDVASASRMAGVELDEVLPDGTFNPALRSNSGLGFLYDAAVNELSRFRVLEGRLPAPDQPDEVMINRVMVDRTGWRVGDTIDSLRLYRLEDVDQNGEPVPAKGEPLQLRVVGIAARPDELLVERGDRIPRVFLPPAFGDAHPDSWFYINEYVKLRNGKTDAGALHDGVDALVAETPNAYTAISNVDDGRRAVAQALRPQVVGLWLLALVMLTAGALIAVQAIGRQIQSRERDLPILRALGMSRSQRTGLGVAHAATVAVTATAVALLVGFASSVFTPGGSTHEIEPHPGLTFDAAVLLPLAGVLLVMTVAGSIIPVWRLAHRSERAQVAAAELGGVNRPSRLADWVATRTPSPAAAIGVRMALQPGRGRTAAPVRSVMASIMIAVAVLATSIGFANNLDRFVNTPRLYGWDWDIGVGSAFGKLPADGLDAVMERPEVAAAAGLAFGDIRIDGETVPAVGVDLLRGTVFPTLDSGRLPQSDQEIVLGRRTLRRLHRHVGDTVDVETPQGEGQMTIVGIATFPALGTARFQQTSLGDGAATVASAFASPDDEGADKYNYVFIRGAPGSDLASPSAELRSFFLELGCNEACYTTDLRPESLSGYGRLGPLVAPFALGLGALLAVSLVHGVVASVRARRRDLAILHAIGFTHRQTGAAVIWEAATLATGALLIGVPLGLLGSQFAWQLFTGSLGVRPGSVLPLAYFALVVVGVETLAVLIGAAATPLTRRTGPAQLLQLE
jgi:ABC-type lipoprotein release transport system permease subunit